SGFARSWRQSKMRHCPRWAASSAVETRVVLTAKTRVQPLVEVHFRVFHRRLVGPGVVEARLVERAAAAIELVADHVVLDRRLGVGRLLRFDELALEEGDFL